MRYAELQVTTNFSFLRGASHGEELVAQAKELGLSALAVTDRNTLAGVVRAHVAAKEAGLRLIIGARLDLQDAPSLLCFPKDRAAYGRLSRLLSLGQGRAEKGQCILFLDDVAVYAEGNIFVAIAEANSASPSEMEEQSAANASFQEYPPPPGGEGSSLRKAHSRSRTPRSSRRSGTFTVRVNGKTVKIPDSRIPSEVRLPGMRVERGAHVGEVTSSRERKRAYWNTFEHELCRLKAALGTAPLYLAATHLYRGDDRARIAALADLAARCGTPLVATNDVLYHAAHRQPLQDVLTCIREHTTIDKAGFFLEANAERHLKKPSEMARLFTGFEEAIDRTIDIMDACSFSLDELVYEYPDEPVPPGKTPQEHLETLAWDGAAWRFPGGIPEKVRTTLRRELQLVADLEYAPYFLTVYDIVVFARAQGILCQGRGSAANSVICYCLGVTAVNPAEVDLLFERFVSHARKEPPDIDVDFEHDRREEVIQYIYARYGRDRAGLTATVISYRARSAVRDVGKAMGLSEDTVSALAGMVWGTRSSGVLGDKRVREAGLDPDDPLLARVLELTDELIGFPRHLSQHVGGFVLTRGPLIEVVPVGNAVMEDRTFIEWDKDDIAALGLLKVDVLGLGMLSCIRRAFELLHQHHGLDMSLAKVPREDEATYNMLCRADTIGVFQVESRAQMNMLPRLKPCSFYDLVIEVAIVRPGPIQGDMVHPYLRRRSGVEAETYPSPAPEHGPPDELRQILDKTKGVPLFQEQAMRIAMDAAKFTDAEVNELRKAMATFRRRGTIGLLEDKMVSQMVARGYEQDFAQRCFNQIKGFGEYGFPESHAASFAHLVYVSSWLKCHYPAAFACALLNSQPMGFYAPAQLVRCAREHGVEAREADVNLSDWDSTLEFGGSDGGPALRLGLRQIDGLQEDEIEKLIAARMHGMTGKITDDSSPPCEPKPPAATNAFSQETSPPPGGTEKQFAANASFPEYPPPPGGEGLGVGGACHALPVRIQSQHGAAQTLSPEDIVFASQKQNARVFTPPLAPPHQGEGNAGHEQWGGERCFRSVHDLWMRAGLRVPTLQKLAAADAFRSMGLDRRQALWEVKALANAPPLPLFTWSETQEAGTEPAVALPEMPLSEHVINDYQTLRLSLKAHPMSFLRDRLNTQRIAACSDVRSLKDGAFVRVAGVVLVRQRPGSAKGVVFMTIEDETGVANAVVWPKALERFRKVVMAARLILITGRIQRHEDIIHIVSSKLEDKSDRLLLLSEWANDMRAPIANADEVLRPDPGSARSADDLRHHSRWAGHPRNERIIPKSRDFH